MIQPGTGALVREGGVHFLTRCLSHCVSISCKHGSHGKPIGNPKAAQRQLMAGGGWVRKGQSVMLRGERLGPPSVHSSSLLTSPCFPCLALSMPSKFLRGCLLMQMLLQKHSTPCLPLQMLLHHFNIHLDTNVYMLDTLTLGSSPLRCLL